jgi:hypothetical protein
MLHKLGLDICDCCGTLIREGTTCCCLVVGRTSIGENKMLDTKTVEALVEAKGTKFATVKFIKKDGTERVINGLFKPSSKIIGNEKGAKVSMTLKNNDLIPIYSVAEKSWKCFNKSAVVEIN